MRRLTVNVTDTVEYDTNESKTLKLKHCYWLS